MGITRKDGQRLWHLILFVSTSAAQPSWEPAAFAYWVEGAKVHGAEATTAFPVLNFQPENISVNIFDRLVREGRPFVVRGVGKSHPMRKFDCHFFRENALFANLQARREYAAGNTSQPQWKALKDILWTSKASNADGEQMQDDRQGSNPKSPYYVGLKDVLNDPEELEQDPLYSSTWSKEVLKLVQMHSSVPDFMPPRNLDMIYDTPEFWFVEAGGTGGAKAHVDAHAESTWSLQLCGEKRWRISPIASRNAPHVMKMYQDGQIYERSEQRSWNLFEDVVLSSGDAIFFGPGFIHQTEVVGESPGASITWQFNQPLPTTFLRKFMMRIRFTPDLLASWQQIHELIKLSKTASMSEIRRSPDLLDFLDVNGDGKVVPEEREEVLTMWSSVLEQVRSYLPQKLQKVDLGLRKVVHDEDDLKHMPKKIQSAVRAWEMKAFRLDEAVTHPSPHTEL